MSAGENDEHGAPKYATSYRPSLVVVVPAALAPGPPAATAPRREGQLLLLVDVAPAVVPRTSVLSTVLIL